MIQESLTNVAKHAHADRVAVDVAEHENDIAIVVRDDGKGFEPGAPAEGFGLTGMRERVALLGGHLELSSSPAGTTVHVSLPSTRAMRQTA